MAQINHEIFYFERKRKFNRALENTPIRKFQTKDMEDFPFQHYGILNVKELAEVIKYLYQFQKDKEYFIITVGMTESKVNPKENRMLVKPHLYFLIGNEKTLAPYQSYQGKYVESNELYQAISNSSQESDFICIELDRDLNNSLGITCFTGDPFDSEDKINYYNEFCSYYCSFGLNIEKQILKKEINEYFPRIYQNEVQDLFNFSIHSADCFLAKILLNIILYKKRHHLECLTEKDYRYIFNTLFQENVDILGDVEKDIPKKLIYEKKIRN